MRDFIKKWWAWITTGLAVLFGLLVFALTRKKEKKKPKPFKQMHDEAVDIIVEISEKEYDEIDKALSGDSPADDIAGRINGSGGPL